MKHKYAVIIQWSDQDDAYIATLPEWGTHTHGATYEEAARMAEEALDLLLEGEASPPRPETFVYPGATLRPAEAPASAEA
jgi:antitoxin HicB